MTTDLPFLLTGPALEGISKSVEGIVKGVSSMECVSAEGKKGMSEIDRLVKQLLCQPRQVLMQRKLRGSSSTF